MNRPSLPVVCGVAAILLAPVPAASAAERFDDIVVSPQSTVSGETQHGYREIRVLLENQSPGQTHRVTLIYPDRSFAYGNSVSRVSRTVSLGPASRASVPLWQPPLPVSGNSSVRVLVDDDPVGTVGLPDNPRHMARPGSRFGGPPLPTTILVSRSLNYDEISRVLKSDTGHAPFSAAMATGAPDSRGRRGTVPTAWMPDASRPGPHWIELDYDRPMPAKGVRIYDTMGLPPVGEVVLTGISGTNLATIRISGPSGVRRTGAVRELSFPLTTEPVKTVRLNFGSLYAGSIAVDAVELEGATTDHWASSARASSESTGMPSAYPGRPGMESCQLLRAELPVADWSEHWLSYTPFDAVALNAADLAGMPPAVQTALWRYAECGGNLLLFGGGEVPQPWQSLATSSLEGGRSSSVGFGRCFAFTSESATNLTATAVKAFLDAANGSARYWQTLPDEAGANASFPVIQDTRVPVRSTVFIMLAFVILIGPVNLIVLSRLNRRTWLLWTIPAISLVTCLIVFGYSLVREGVTPDVRIGGLTLLDQVNRRAATVGITAFYCPLTPSQGLFFDSDTEATPLVQVWSYGFRSSGGGNPRQMDWTQAQHLQQGWVTARVPAHFQLCKSELRRERLQVETAGGHLTVVNGLGAAIRSLWLADHSGRIYTAAQIAAGQKAGLVPCADFPNVTARLGVRALFEKAGYNPPETLPDADAASYLLPDTYLAELDTNPFIENGLGPKAKSARTKSRAVVYGILETSP